MILDEMLKSSKLTGQEREVLDFISNNPQRVLGMTVHEVAKASFSSSSTVIRLCQKAGVSGFTEFKYKLATELPTIIELDDDLKSNGFNGNEASREVLDRIETVHRNSLKYTKNIFNTELLNRVASLLKSADRIEIYGDGLNYPLAQLFCLNFQEVGVEAEAYDSLNLMHAKVYRNRKVRPLAFILTHTGNNEHMYGIAKKLKTEDYKIVVVCDSVKRSICRLCDETMVIKTTKNTLELSNIVYISSIQYLFDVLMSLKMLNNYSEVSETSDEVEKIKERQN